MSQSQTSAPRGFEPEDGLPASEANLGKAMALVHHVLRVLDDANRATEVQTALRKAGEFIESARLAHAHERGLAGAGSSLASSDSVTAEVVAIVAAAVAMVIDRPHRVVSVVSVEMPPHLNVWAVEGRSQIFMSHKVR